MENKNDKFEIRRVLGRNYNDSDDNEQVQENLQPDNIIKQENNVDKNYQENNLIGNNFSQKTDDSNIKTNSLNDYVSQIIDSDNNSSSSRHGIFVWIFMILIVALILFIVGINLDKPNNHIPSLKYEEPQANNSDTPKNTKSAQQTTPIKTEQKPLNNQSKIKEPEKKIEPVEIKTVPKNKYSNPDEYLMQVKRILQNSYSSSYSVDCTLTLTPQGNVSGLKGSGNDDVAYNFLNSQSSNIPKFVDSNSKTVPLLIKFSGHSIESVKFQYAPIQSTPKKPVQTQSKQNTQSKSDLQKTSDWFFE